MRLVILESPFAGSGWWLLRKWRERQNVAYALKCVRDSLLRNEAPIASHLVYPRVLDDTIPEERQHGIDAGLAWKAVAHASVVYTDRGITRGMKYGIEAAKAAGIPVEYRSIAP
jgi:hypothetical protein